ncbi:MAG: M55 family metallopeptidase, partial [Kordiimonadaceae bacterium]|nr:M55 family metallopeptidase [Kordiimonadaceae bacterium]
MKIFISADIEGVTGIVHRDQIFPGEANYAQGCRLMTQDINAAIEGALSAEPSAKFLVCDGHGTMRNILLEQLNPAAQLVVGPANRDNKPLCQSEGVDDSFDMAFLVGYHSQAGTPGGVLSHTLLSLHVCNFRINGDIVGEAAINTAICGSFQVPVTMISGNSEVLPEATATMPGGFTFATTKKSIGYTAAICKSLPESHAEIKTAAHDAVLNFWENAVSPLTYQGQVTMEVEAYRREFADKACVVAGIEKTGERSF